VQPADSASAPSPVAKLSAVTSSDDYDHRPCFQMMRSGVCDNDDCPFQHAEKSLMNGILRSLEEITQYPLFDDIGVDVVFPHGYHVTGSSSDLTKSPPSDQRRVPTSPHTPPVYVSLPVPLTTLPTRKAKLPRPRCVVQRRWRYQAAWRSLAYAPRVFPTDIGGVIAD
jgi:hypothetical protein